MANGDPPDIPGEPKKPDLRVVPKDHPPARLSPETMHQLYMASPHVEWTPFAASKEMDPWKSRDGLPWKEWIDEKKDTLNRQMAESIGDAVFRHRGRWHKDVLKTLEVYPEVNDALLNILKLKLNDMTATIRDATAEISREKALGKTSKKKATDGIDIKDLKDLSQAVRYVTDSKHRSLMINDWSFQIAEKHSDPNQFEKDEDKNSDWVMPMIGGEGKSAKELQKGMLQWFDRPTIPDEVEGG